MNALRQELVTKGNSLDEVKKAVKDVSTMYIFTIRFGKTSRTIKAFSRRNIPLLTVV